MAIEIRNSVTPNGSAAKPKTQNSPHNAVKPRKRGRSTVDPMPQIIARVSQKNTNEAHWNRHFSERLVSLWIERMSLADRKIAMAGGLGWVSQISPESIRVFDELIIRQAGTAGWRIGLSEWVHWRLSEWEQTPEHLPQLRRYYHALIQAARIFQRSKKPPLDDPGLYVPKWRPSMS